ncbi:macrophage scavenger receptor types I and II-like [Acropora muricata]|uniref:macrophage scavenger receptor types I and II-like n=1 Tax=Acropora muricata TaxID=159855 RepID=UPI0034E54499
MQTALNHDKGKETAARDYLNTNEGQDRRDSTTAVKECSTDDLFLNRKTTPSPKVLSWNTEEKETLAFVRSRHPRGDRVILLVLCLMCAAALGLSVLMLLGVLRPHGPPDTKIGSNSSTSNSNQTVAGDSLLSKNIQEFKEQVTTGFKTTQKEMSEELANMLRNHSEMIRKELEDIKSKHQERYAEIRKELEDIKGKYEKIKAEMATKNVSVVPENSNKTDNTSLVWGVIQTVKQECLQEVHKLEQKDNTSLVWGAIKTFKQEFLQEVHWLDQKIANITKKEGPVGPPGYNGTRGPPGESGLPGPPGINGTQGVPGTSPTGGDLTLCSYQEKKGTEDNAGSYASTHVSVNEANGKKIIGASCASNDAKVVLLSSSTSGGTRKYRCDCSGTQNTGVSKMYCSIHYWEC